MSVLQIPHRAKTGAYHTSPEIHIDQRSYRPEFKKSKSSKCPGIHVGQRSHWPKVAKKLGQGAFISARGRKGQRLKWPEVEEARGRSGQSSKWPEVEVARG